MLEEQLAEESRRATRRIWQITLLFTGAAAIVALFLLDVVRLDFENLMFSSTELAQQEGIQPQPSPIIQSSPTKATKDDLTEETPNFETGLPSASLQKTTKETTGIVLPTPPVPDGANLNAEKRDAFKEKVSAFEGQYRLEIEAEQFGFWNKLSQETILANYNSALSAFAAANYDVAIAAIDAATEEAAKELERRATAFKTAMREASQAYELDDVETAAINIERALQIDPGSNEARELKQGISKLPNILDLQEKASIARLENNLDREAKLLKNVIELDPNRTHVKDRLKEVVTEIAEIKFARAIDDGVRHVEKRDLRRAANALKSAESIYKTREEAKLLRRQVAELRVELEVEATVRKGIEASGADQWDQALKHFSEALKKLPENKDAADGKTLSLSVLESHTKLDRHLASPERLSAGNVAEEVKRLIDSTRVYEPFSASLSRKVAELKQNLSDFSVPVPVWVNSDGQTDVSVRGVGRVGVTTGRAIELKPGTYLFEGKRPGYRNKIIEFKVPVGDKKVTVEVVCDERV